MRARCALCPRRCELEEGETGFCRARINAGGVISGSGYGHVTALALDPIEKKPLRRFFPGSRILSMGGFGCNLRCPFCQNHTVSMAGDETPCAVMQPEELVEQALLLRDQGNIGLAYTYNEPLTGYEFVRDCAQMARQAGLKNVLVTNGCFLEDAVRPILREMDAVNIDLKGFTQSFYQKLGGDLETVKNTIRLAAESCHLEITTLVIPGENDSPAEMEALAAWVASVNREIPLHVSRFFPGWNWVDRAPTPVKTVRGLAETARGRLRYVYEGNC